LTPRAQVVVKQRGQAPRAFAPKFNKKSTKKQIQEIKRKVKKVGAAKVDKIGSAAAKTNKSSIGMIKNQIQAGQNLSAKNGPKGPCTPIAMKKMPQTVSNFNPFESGGKKTGKKPLKFF